MKIDFALFAYSALLTGDGLFSLLGGGIKRLTAKSLPAKAPNLVFLVCLLLDPEECGKTHECVVKVSDPAGNTLTPDLMVQVKSETDPEHQERMSTFTAHYGYDGLLFEKLGYYRFEILTAGRVLGEAVLELRVE